MFLKVDPISLFPFKYEDYYAIKYSEDNDLICTPSKNILKDNKNVIEKIIYEIQKFDLIQIDEESNSIDLSSVNEISLYSLVSFKIDSLVNPNQEEKFYLINEIVKRYIGIDPFINSFLFNNIINSKDQVEKEKEFNLIQVDKFNQNLENLFLSFPENVSNEEDNFKINNDQMTFLVDLIWNVFLELSVELKILFIKVLNLYSSPILGLVICSKNIPIQSIAREFSKTKIFKSNVQILFNKEINQSVYKNSKLLNNAEDIGNDIYNQSKSYFFKCFLSDMEVFNQYKELFIDELPEELLQEESITLEYKTSFRRPYPDYPEGIKNKNGQIVFQLGKAFFKSKKEINTFIETQSLKSIVAFLNSKGGTLVIGVNEKDNQKKLIGIENDDFVSQDQYIRDICQRIINRIGKEFLSNYLDINIKTIEGKMICFIKCQPYIPKENQIPAFLDDKLYIRTGPRTDEISPGKEVARFISERILK